MRRRLARPHRQDLDRDLTHLLLVAQAQAFPAHGLAARQSLVQGAPELHEQPWAGHLEEVHGRLPRRRLQIGTGAPPELQDVELLVDEHAGRGVTAQEQPIGFLMEVRRGRARRARPRAGCARRLVVLDRELDQRPAARDLLRIDLVRPVHHLEQPVELPHRLGRPEHQESRHVERVMEGRQDPPLQRRGHVDQDIAATDQIHMRERRIGGDVLAREDAAIADRLVDTVEYGLPS